MTPYIVVFSVAAVVSVSTISMKAKLFIEHLRESSVHPEVLASRVGPIRIDTIEFPADLAQLQVAHGSRCRLFVVFPSSTAPNAVTTNRFGHRCSA